MPKFIVRYTLNFGGNEYVRYYGDPHSVNGSGVTAFNSHAAAEQCATELVSDNTMASYHVKQRMTLTALRHKQESRCAASSDQILEMMEVNADVLELGAGEKVLYDTLFILEEARDDAHKYAVERKRQITKLCIVCAILAAVAITFGFLGA